MVKKSFLIVESLCQAPRNLENLLESIGFGEGQRMALRDLNLNGALVLPNVVFYSCRYLNETQVEWVLNVSSRYKSTQFVVLAQQISIYAYQRVSKMMNMVAVQVPCDEKIFEKVVREVAAQDLEKLIRFPRFITDEPARIVVMDTGLLIPTRMKNYSVGGAFLEYKGISLKVGHKLKVNLLNQEAPKVIKSSPSSLAQQLQMNGRVVWIRDGDPALKALRGVGVQFVDLLLNIEDQKNPQPLKKAN